MEALPLASASLEHLEVLGDGVYPSLFADNLDMSLNDIADVTQEGGCALLTLLLDADAKARGLTRHDVARWRRDLAADFVASDLGEGDGLEHMDPIDDPVELGFPVNGAEDASRGGGGHDLVAHAL